MKTINQSILEVGTGIITHQVNCQGVMGAGLAKDLRDRYPVIYPRYAEFCKSGQLKIGMVQFINVAPSLYACNLAGQDGYGRAGIHTDYKAVEVAFQKLNTWARQRDLQVYIPFGMGCGLAGGEWSIVEGLIERWCEDAIVCKF